MYNKSIEILKSALLFENKVIVLAEEANQPLVHVPMNFYYALVYFLSDLHFSKEDVENWVKVNKNVLLEKLDNYWALDYEDRKYIYSNNSRIYKQPVDYIDGVEIHKSNLLMATEKIPKLWLYEISYVPGFEGLNNINADLSHNDYLIKAFKELFETEGVELATATQTFYNTNKNKIDKLRLLFEKQPELLGSGYDGVAFSVGKNLVLKLFKDSFAFNKAKEAVKRLHLEPQLAKTEAMIYDLGQLGTFNGSPVYFYIMEKMKPIGDLPRTEYTSIKAIIKTIIERVRVYKFDGLRSLKQNINDATFHPKIREYLDQLKVKINKEILSLHKNEIDNINRGLSVNNNWLSSLIEEILVKYLTSRTDLHAGNIGLTNYGEFRYFDAAHSNWGTNINEPEDWHSEL